MVRERFKDRDLLEISYETFESDIPGYLEKAQIHIGLEPIPLPVNDVKKEVRGLSDIISNYDQLKSHFKDTQWAMFFD